MSDQEKSPAVEGYKLSDAMSLFSAQTASMYQLWAFYTATVLGSIVFGLSRSHTWMSAAIFLAGYWAFSLGELALLTQTMRLVDASRACVAATYRLHFHNGSEDLNNLSGVVSHIQNRENPIWISVAIQVLGSICVTLLILLNVAGWVPLPK